MKRPGILCTILLAALSAASLPAHSSDCRALLRPVLLDPAPDAAALDAVRELCREQAAAGDADAVYQLALFHLGLGGEWNPDVAVPMIREAAEGGVSEAQYWLAWQMESGPLLPDDAAASLAWYERAAGHRHRLALERLAAAYERGELGLRVDATRALELRAEIRRCDDESRP